MAKDGMLIEAGPERPTLADFASVVVDFQRLVYALTDEVGGKVTWVIDELRLGSTRTGVVRLEDTDEAIQTAAAVVDRYLELGRALQAGAMPPEASPKVLRPVEALREVLPRVRYLRFETPEDDVTVTAEEQGRVQALYPRRRPAAGAVIGTIDVLSRRGRLRFGLIDRASEHPVSCYMSPGQEELLRDLWGRLVIVEGMVSRDPVSGRPTAIRHIRSVTPREEYKPGSWREALGIVSLGGQRPEEIVRRLRDA